MHYTFSTLKSIEMEDQLTKYKSLMISMKRIVFKVHCWLLRPGVDTKRRVATNPIMMKENENTQIPDGTIS